MELNQKFVDLIHETMMAQGTELSFAIRDIMTDLCHICHDSGIDPTERFTEAKEVFEEEIEE
jgi:hypothetical protein